MPEVRVEIWRPIPGFAGYEASDLGRVRSWRYGGSVTRRRSTPRVLKPWRAGYGYLAVALCDGEGGSKKRYVHALVLEAFVGPCPEGMEARHVDSNDKSNNALSNLAWGTKLENELDKERHGTRLRGERVKSSRLTEDNVRSIKRLLVEGAKQNHVAEMFGVNKVTVFDIAHGRSWRHVS